MVLPDLRQAAKSAKFGAIDALAAVTDQGTILLSIVNRGSAGPVKIKLSFDDFQPAASAEVQTLSASQPWEGNSLEQPELIKPSLTTVAVRDGQAEFELAPFSVARLTARRQ